MASSQSSVDFILEQANEAGAVRAKKMFGEYGIYCDEKIVALFCDEQLFMKPTPGVREFVGETEEGFPYPGAKSYLIISGERWDNREFMSKLFQIAASELPAPKPKSIKKKTVRKK